MRTITAIGHGGGLFIFNVADNNWDFQDDVDTCGARYSAIDADLPSAIESAEDTLLTDIVLSDELA